MESKIYKTEKGVIRVTFTDQTKEEQDKVFMNFIEASYKLAKKQYQRGIEKTNDNSNLDS